MNIKYLLIELIVTLQTIGLLISLPVCVAFYLIRVLYKFWKSKEDLQKSIAGQVALVTGSARGLGRELAIALAKKGCHIAVVDVQGRLAEETAKYIAENYNVKTKAYKIDITDHQQLLALKTKVIRDLGEVTILINNAGILTLSSIDNPPPNEIERMFNVNATALINLTYLFLPKMKELNRGYIVNISSAAAILNHPWIGIYAATKAAVRSFTTALRIDLLLSNSKVKATAVLPAQLTVNKRINELVKILKFDRFVQPVDGCMAVECIIRGMMCGDEEVTIPHALAFFGKVSGLFPAYIYEKVIAYISKLFMKSLHTEEFQNLLKANDLEE